MNTLSKILVALLALGLVGALGFIVYQNHEMKVQQGLISQQMLAQKQLIDGITRSSEQYATKDDINKFISDNGINLKAIQDDLQSLHAQISAANVITVSSSGQNGTSLPSTGTGTKNPVVVTSPDPYGYLKATQLFSLDEDFQGGVKVPFGQVGFSAFQSKPWSFTVSPREYKITNVIGTDENQKTYVYNKMTIHSGSTDYDVKITSAETKQELPQASWSFWNPRLYLAATAGISIQQPVVKVTGQVTPSLNFSFISYGQFKNQPDLSLAQIGLGMGLVDVKPQIVLVPIAYRIGKQVDFIRSTYIAPSLGIGTNGSFNIGAGVTIGL
jgi:hypothetical protein